MPTVRLLLAAPYSIRTAAGLSAFEAVVWSVLVIVSAPDGLPARNTPFLILGVALGVLVFASLFYLPIAVSVSRYPLRRYREAIVFQALLLFVFVDGLVAHPSLVGAVLSLAALSSIFLLLLPGTRTYVSGREARFTAALRGDQR